MTSQTELVSRIDALEEELRRLARELTEVRALAGTVTRPAAPTPRPVPPALMHPPARPAPAHPPAQPASAVRRQARPSRPSRGEAISDLARKWDLLGPRGFAIAGGAVTALGIVLLFVLAANRGWIGPEERVALGALASALVFTAGLVLHARYGQYAAALGAVGAGIVGAYASLAAATALYDLVPDEMALALAALIAGVATAVSLRWSSEIVAGIGLVGSALAPALEAIDTGMTAASAAFAVIVLAATGTLAVMRRWQILLAVVAAVVGAQTLALLGQPESAGDPATVAVAAALALVVLGVAVGLQLSLTRSTERAELRRLPLSLVLADTGFALWSAALLFDAGRDRGLALGVCAAGWAVTWALVRMRERDLGLVLGVTAMALAAVATADLLPGDALAVAWAAQAAVLAILASRLRDARLAVLGYGYLTLSGVQALVFASPPAVLFDRVEASTVAAIAPAAVAVAAATAGITLARGYRSTGERGLLAWLDAVRVALEGAYPVLREVLVFVAGVFGVYAAAVLAVGISFEGGHVVATGIAAAAAATCVAVAAQRRSSWLVVAGLAALALVLGEAVGFDIDELSWPDDRSLGGWSVLEAAAGLLAGGVSLRILHPTTRRLGLASGVAAAIALGAAMGGVALVVPADDDAFSGPEPVFLGVGFSVIALVYLTVAAAEFRVERLRNLSTTLWSLGLLAVLAAETAFVGDARGTAFAFALTGGMVAVLSRPLGEPRLWTAGASVVGVATIWTMVAFTQPAHFVTATPSPAAGLWVLAGCVAALVALAVSAPAYATVTGCIAAGFGLYAVSLGILELAVEISPASLPTDFERGHTAVSAVWALLGLGLLVVGLLRASKWLRLAGFVLFGVSLAKIFLYDLSELSSVARAFSFIAVGALLLAGGFFLQRLSEHLGPRRDASAV
jgi:uncharacterized membrane protein